MHVATSCATEGEPGGESYGTSVEIAIGCVEETPKRVCLPTTRCRNIRRRTARTAHNHLENAFFLARDENLVLSNDLKKKNLSRILATLDTLFFFFLNCSDSYALKIRG